MKITEIQVNLATHELKSKDNILGMVRLVFDGEFAVRDIKILERNGCIFLAMPARRVTEPCINCQRRIDTTDAYCCFCGVKLPTPHQDPDRRTHIDTAHPITPQFRRYLERHILPYYNDLVPPDKTLRLKDA